jgi:hypothetical protein
MVEGIIREKALGSSEIKFNLPRTKKLSDGTSYLTSRMQLPQWVETKTLEEQVDDFELATRLNIERISDARPINILRDSPIFPDVRKEFRVQNVLEDVKQQAPTDGVEVVEWMQESAAEGSVISGWRSEYGENSSVLTAFGDPTAPHDLIEVPDFNFVPRDGRDVFSRGEAEIKTPEGSTTIPNKSSRLLPGKDSIGWGGVDARNNYQWLGKVAQFKDIARTPIENPVRFPDFGDYNLPNVFNQSPPDESNLANINLNISSNAPEKLNIAFRDPNDYRNILTQNEVDIPEGTSNLNFEVASSERVPPVLAEFQPVNASGAVQSLESYTVTAI